jgi:hypothetical protein
MPAGMGAVHMSSSVGRQGMLAALGVSHTISLTSGTSRQQRQWQRQQTGQVSSGANQLSKTAHWQQSPTSPACLHTVPYCPQGSNNRPAVCMSG